MIPTCPDFGLAASGSILHFPYISIFTHLNWRINAYLLLPFITFHKNFHFLDYHKNNFLPICIWVNLVGLNWHFQFSCYHLENYFLALDPITKLVNMQTPVCLYVKQVRRLQSDPPGPMQRCSLLCFWWSTYGRTPCVKIMTIYAAGAWWVKYRPVKQVNFFLDFVWRMTLAPSFCLSHFS